MPWFTRLWFAFVCLLRVLFDPSFAARVWAVRASAARLSAPSAEPPAAAPRVEPPAAAPAPGAAEREDRAAVAPLQLLALLQREGRLIDFLQQDITAFDDTDVGVAARVVHDGCGRALAAHASFEPIRSEQEDSPLELSAGYDAAEFKLTGHVTGKPPYRGTLRHRGWRLRELRLPEPLAGHDFHVIAPAEVEL